jgi:hypothetical protein
MRRVMRFPMDFGPKGFSRPGLAADGRQDAVSWLLRVAARATAPVFSPVL